MIEDEEGIAFNEIENVDDEDQTNILDKNNIIDEDDPYAELRF
jgi:hypothetical protein